MADDSEAVSGTDRSFPSRNRVMGAQGQILRGFRKHSCKKQNLRVSGFGLRTKPSEHKGSAGT